MNKILVISAHPDDETLGVGGTLLKHKSNGDQLFWLNATKIDNGDPIAFSLGSSMSDAFSSLDEQSDNLLKDKVYKWDLLNNNNNISLSNTDVDMNTITPISSTNDIDKLPSLEELLNKRNNEVF